jgi:hypothetical protein
MQLKGGEFIAPSLACPVFKGLEFFVYRVVIDREDVVRAVSKPGGHSGAQQTDLLIGSASSGVAKNVERGLRRRPFFCVEDRRHLSELHLI